MTQIIDGQATPLKIDQDGVIRIGGTRVTLDTVIHHFIQGYTAEEISSHFPALGLADVYSTIAYYLNNQAEVQTYLREQAVEAQKIWEKIEANSDYQSFRERLLARRREKVTA